MPRAGAGELYAYPYPGAPTLPSQTEKGLRNISQTIILFVLIDAMGIVLLLAFLPLIAAAVISPSDPGFLAAAITILAVVCVLLVVIVIGLILGLVGLLALHKGRDEFGPAHAQKIDHGLIVLIIGIIVPGVVSGIGGTSAGGLGTVGLSPQITLVGALSELAGGVLGALLVGLFLLWSIEALATPQIRQRGMMAFILGLAAGIARGVASLAVLYAVGPPSSAATLAQFIPYIIPGTVSAGLSIASLAVWYLAYKAVLDRFKRGELRAAPPAIMMPPPYPPAYYPYPQPYVPQPAPPPPAEPPPASPPPNP
ncbi:MAG: hypothetical protein E6K10_07965 [Methanobacteriota archaeon]|nr:MAG: hypothetical protein E6K10_07965 [Euryarchaeota archaeon]